MLSTLGNACRLKGSAFALRHESCFVSTFGKFQQAKKSFHTANRRINLVLIHSGSFRGSKTSRHLTNQIKKQKYHSTRERIPISGDNVVLGLIGVNTLVCLMWRAAETPQKRRLMLHHFTTSFAHLSHGSFHTLLTSVFSHAKFDHFFMNMIGLYFFGGHMARVLGPTRFLQLYLGSGIFSSFASVYEQKYTNRFSINLGASGAVNAITATSILMFPHNIILIFGVIPMPAYLAGSMFILKDFYGWITGSRDGIGHFAHLCGALYGGIYFQMLRRSSRLRRW
jgi:membrane associated rhomboid family serine protease